MATRNDFFESLSLRRQRCADRHDWRCKTCSKKLGKRIGDRVLLKFAREHQYDCSLPVTSVCRCCGTLNVLHKTS